MLVTTYVRIRETKVRVLAPESLMENFHQLDFKVYFVLMEKKLNWTRKEILEKIIQNSTFLVKKLTEKLTFLLLGVKNQRTTILTRKIDFIEIDVKNNELTYGPRNESHVAFSFSQIPSNNTLSN